MTVPAPSSSHPPNTKRSAGTLLATSLVLAGLQLADLMVWSRAFDRGHSQPERVAIYLATLPAFLANAGTLRLTLLATLCGAVGTAFAFPVAIRCGRPLAILGWAALVANALFVAWHLFTLM